MHRARTRQGSMVQGGVSVRLSVCLAGLSVCLCAQAHGWSFTLLFFLHSSSCCRICFSPFLAHARANSSTAGGGPAISPLGCRSGEAGTAGVRRPRPSLEARLVAFELRWREFAVYLCPSLGTLRLQGSVAGRAFLEDLGGLGELYTRKSWL